MQITAMEPTNEWQIGGGAGYVAAQVREGIIDAKLAMELTVLDWNDTPHV